MKRVIFWFPLLLVVSSALLRAEERPVKLKLPTKDKFHLYLLIGQSNMAGRGKIAAGENAAHPRVLKFTKEQTWAPGVDPLHFDKPIAGVGLGSSFARVMAEADAEITIGLIPCAVGGTPLSRWQKGGDLYEQALQRARAAMQDGTLQGVLWHQGESDAADPDLAQTYAKRLAGMIADLRSDLQLPQLPFVAGKLGEFLPDSSQGKPSHWRTINQQLESLPEQVSNVAIVDSSGLKHHGDQVHFDTASLREFGRRYAHAMQRLQSRDGNADANP